MKTDKLTLRAEIQNDFNNESVKNINLAIKISKIMKFLYAESTIFIISMLPMLAMTIYGFIVASVEVAASTGVVLMLTHFVLYKTLYKKVLFKDSNLFFDKYNYTIEVLNDIKSEKA